MKLKRIQYIAFITPLLMQGCGGSQEEVEVLNVSSLGGGGGAVTALGSAVTNQHRFFLIVFESGSIHQVCTEYHCCIYLSSVHNCILQVELTFMSIHIISQFPLHNQ